MKLNNKIEIMKCTIWVASHSGMLLAQIGKTDEEVTRSFSASVQMHDTLVKAWGLWADYLENIFTNNPQNMQ